MLTYLGEGYHEIFREIHVCNLFSNGQEEKNGVTYRDKANVAKCIQRIHSDRVHEYW